MAKNITFSNPFTPSFGRVPPILAGRKLLLSEMGRAFNSNGSDPSLCTILIGARGSGKTALLVYLAQEAQSYGWVSASVSAMPGMLEDIIERAMDSADGFVEEPGSTRLKSVSVGQLFGVEWEYRESSSGNWRTRMNRLLDRLAEYDIGLVITVDEVVADLDELRQLASVYQHFVSEGRKVALLMAGLPGNVSALLEDRSVSFLLRATQRELERLSDQEVRSALQDTAASAGKRFTDDALDSAVRAVEGFPYLLQLVGFYSWEESGARGVIELTDAENGAKAAVREFENGVLKRVYTELSPQDRAVLMAMLPDGDTASIADIATRLGKSTSYVRVYRKRLVERGVLTAIGRSEVAFALPLMSGFLARSGN